jgi:protein-disulfide isomerase
VSSRAGQKQAARVVREQLEKERRRRRTLWITLGAVVVLVIAAAIGVAVWSRQSPSSTVQPAGVTDDGGTDAGIQVAGTGPVTVEVYLDFLCPACRQFEEQTGPAIDQLAADNKIRLVWHPLGFLDDLTNPSGYSTRSASAAGCAADGGKLQAFGEALFAQQPAEGGPGLTDDQIIDIGGNVGLIAPSFAQCVREVRYDDWVSHVTNEAARRGVTATPTIFVAGQRIDQPTTENVTAAIEAAS